MTWKQLLDTTYNISDNGLIKNKNDKIMKYTLTGDGYHRISITHTPTKRKTYLVHRLVAITFIINPKNKKTINHIDGNKTNNITSNLEWASHSENTQHCYNKLNPNKRCKSVLQCDKNWNIIQEFKSIADASRITDTHVVGIAQCCRKQKHRMNAGGFKWKFKDNLKKDINISTFVPVYKFNKYLINTKGHIYSKKYRHLLSPSIKGGYYQVNLYTNNTKKKVTKKLHILVAETFLDKPKKGNIVVNHKDLNKLNNSLNNLEYITQSENRLHYFNTSDCSKTVYQIIENEKLVIEYDSVKDAAKELNFNKDYIYNACIGRQLTYKGYKWSYLPILYDTGTV